MVFCAKRIGLLSVCSALPIEIGLITTQKKPTSHSQKIRSTLLIPDPVTVTQAASFVSGSDLCCQHNHLL